MIRSPLRKPDQADPVQSEEMRFIVKIRSYLLLATFVLAALLVLSSTSAYAESLGTRIERGESTLYQINTMVELMYFFAAEKYKKTHTLEEYYEAIWSANTDVCIMCGHKLEKGEK